MELILLAPGSDWWGGSPHMIAAVAIDKLRRDPHPVTGLAYAAFQNVSNVEFGSDCSYIGRSAFVREA